MLYTYYTIHCESYAACSFSIFHESFSPIIQDQVNTMNVVRTVNSDVLPQSLVEEQQSQLNQYECAAGQCVSELQKAQLQVQSLQAKIHESEANNMVWHMRTPRYVWML